MIEGVNVVTPEPFKDCLSPRSEAIARLTEAGVDVERGAQEQQEMAFGPMVVDPNIMLYTQPMEEYNPFSPINTLNQWEPPTLQKQGSSSSVQPVNLPVCYCNHMLSQVCPVCAPEQFAQPVQQTEIPDTDDLNSNDDEEEIRVEWNFSKPNNLNNEFEGI